MKNLKFAKIKGGADSTPNFVATDAEAQRMENRRPVKMFFTAKNDYTPKIQDASQLRHLFFIFLKMNCKKITGRLTVVILLGILSPGFAQNQWTYDFNNGLMPIENGGVPLKMLGQSGQFIKEIVPGSGVNGVPEITRTVYKFANNTGLQFSNGQAQGFLNKSFTVEIYFKMDTLGSWKRVLDFKNRKSDYGSYIYDGKLNFYDYAISEKAPVRAKQYIHYVLSRDFDTKMIKMYVNGLAKVEFKDPGTEGMLDQDQVLNFFQDDLVANHEASAGSVALIRLYDRVMTPVFIRRSFQSISKIAKPDIEEAEEKVAEEPVTAQPESPKTNTNLVNVTGKVYDGATLAAADADVSVRKMIDDSLIVKTKTENGTYNLQLQPHQSYQISIEAPGFHPRTIAVKTANRSQNIKSLVNLKRETYDAPLITLLFNQGNEELDNAAKTELDSMVSYFQKRNDLKIILKGHTDNIGNFSKNLELSNHRVTVVKDYLLGKGIPNDRLEGMGYGSARPDKFDQSEQQRRRNRRVEIWAEPLKR
jgi:OOP family OmpA-OmpF porin